MQGAMSNVTPYPELRLWFLAATSLLYGALCFRLAWTRLAATWPWFMVYVTLASLKMAWWAAARHVPWLSADYAFYPWIETLVMAAKGMAVMEGFSRTSPKVPPVEAPLLLILAGVAFVLCWACLPLGLYTDFAETNRLRLVAHVGMLVLALGSLAMRSPGQQWQHTGLLAAYVGLYVAAGLYDYRIFALPHGSERMARFYFELSWFLPLRAACLVGWWRVMR